MDINLDINVTMRCNTVCHSCNRGIGALDWSNVRDMTVADARRLTDAVKKSGHNIGKVKIVGGEPTIHPDLVEIVTIFTEVNPRKMWVVTNGIKNRRSLPALPDPATYKFDLLEDKDHFAFFVSPADVGLTSLLLSDLNKCLIVNLSGRGVEAEGFTQCSLARTILKALGREEELKFSDEPVLEPDYEICKHCPHALGSRQMKCLSYRVNSGEISEPTKSFVNYKTPKIKWAADNHLHRAAHQDEGLEVITTEELVSSLSRMPKGWEARREQQKQAECKDGLVSQSVS